MPTPAQLQRTIDALMRPLPAGLLTPVGLLVANPAFADRETQARFDNTAYHGTVVWSWQQAVFAAGLSRQLARTDLSADLRTRLQTARSQLWKAIDAGSALRSSELWSWSFSNGHVSTRGVRTAQHARGRIERGSALEHGVSIVPERRVAGRQANA